jgi:hypothetical protein
MLVAQTSRVVPGALADRAPPVRRMGGGRGNDRTAPGDARRARSRRTARLVPREYRQHARARAQKGDLTGPSPVDRGKPGSKIHAIGERGGLPVHVDLSAANLNDHLMLEDMVDGVRPVRQPVGRPRKRPGKLHGDKGYDYPHCRDLLRERNITPRIARNAMSSNAAWNGPPGSGVWSAATNATLPTTSDSCAWPALSSATAALTDSTC